MSLYLTLLMAYDLFALNNEVYKQTTGFGQHGELTWGCHLLFFLGGGMPPSCQKVNSEEIQKTLKTCAKTPDNK